jgi:WXG100 family type VII secretion target
VARDHAPVRRVTAAHHAHGECHAGCIQAQYDTLKEVARRFGQQAEATAQMQGRMQQSLRALQSGGWEGRGSAAFFTEMNQTVLPALRRLETAFSQSEIVVAQIKNILHSAEQEASEPFRGSNFLGKPLMMVADQGIADPPSVPVPGDPSNEWRWNPNPQNRRGGSWGPKRPIPGQGQPSASWDPEGHWDVDDGKGNRQRYDKNGKPLTPEEAHDKKSKAEKGSESSEITISKDFLRIS